MWAKDGAYFHIFSFKLSKNDANSTVPFKTVLRPYKVLRLMYVRYAKDYGMNCVKNHKFHRDMQYNNRPF